MSQYGTHVVLVDGKPPLTIKKTKAHYVRSVYIYGWAGRITKYVLYFALRAALRAFKFVPDKFVEPAGSHTTHQAITNTHPGGHW